MPRSRRWTMAAPWARPSSGMTCAMPSPARWRRPASGCTCCCSWRTGKLTAWHWERLAAPIDGGWDFLSLNQRTPFSLYLPSVTDRRFPPIGRRDLRALIIAASPADLEQRFGLKEFDVGKAVAGVRAGLGEIPHAVLADAAAVPDAAGPPTLDALAERITAEPITLLHFICHGQVADNGETVIYLADAENRVAPVPASQLIERLRRLQGARGLPRFAFLSTCESAAPEAEACAGRAGPAAGTRPGHAGSGRHDPEGVGGHRRRAGGRLLSPAAGARPARPRPSGSGRRPGRAARHHRARPVQPPGRSAPVQRRAGPGADAVPRSSTACNGWASCCRCGRRCW